MMRARASARATREVSIVIRRRLKALELAQPAEQLPSGRIFRISDLCGQGASNEPTPFKFHGMEYNPTKNSHWKSNYPDGLNRIARADRIYGTVNTLNYVRFF